MMVVSHSKFFSPIIIIGAPRSGTTFLKELFSFHAHLWHLTGESHSILEGPLHPTNFLEFSNRPDDNYSLSAKQINKLRRLFWEEAVNISTLPGAERIMDQLRGNRFSRKFFMTFFGHLSKLKKPKERSIRFLEKTPKNAVRIAVIDQIFPDSKYVFIRRDPLDNIYSIYRGWQADTSLLYRMIKGKPRFAASGYHNRNLESGKITRLNITYWRFLLPPGWEHQSFRDLLDVAIFQYLKANEYAEHDLNSLIPAENVLEISYDRLADDTEKLMEHLLLFCDLSPENYNFSSLRKMPKINRSGRAENETVIKEEIEKRLSESFNYQ